MKFWGMLSDVCVFVPIYHPCIKGLPCAKLSVFLGCLQSNQQPKKLKVYPAQVDDDGNISVKFFTANA